MKMSNARSCTLEMRRVMRACLSKIGRIDLIGLILLLGACGGSPPQNQSNPESAAPQPLPTIQASPLTGFEKDLQYVRNGQYTYIWVFSRKDGKPLDRDDGAF